MAQMNYTSACNTMLKPEEEVTKVRCLKSGIIYKLLNKNCS